MISRTIEVEVLSAAFLLPQSQKLKSDIINGLGFKRMNPKVDSEGIEDLEKSLSTFVGYLNHEGRLNDCVKDNLKEGSTVPDGKFVVTDPIKRANIPWLGRFNVDGDYGLVLGIESTKDQTPLWLAGVSFFMTENGPAIVQLQAVRHLFEGHSMNEFIDKQETRDTLKVFHWEKMLACIVGEWAQDMNFRAFYIRPAERNWLTRIQGHLPLERGRIRYNVTAQRLGLRLGPPGERLYPEGFYQLCFRD